MDEKFLPEWSSCKTAMNYLGLNHDTDREILLSLVAEKKITCQMPWSDWTLPIKSDLLTASKLLGYFDPPILPSSASRANTGSHLQFYKPLSSRWDKPRHLVINNSKVVYNKDAKDFQLEVESVVEREEKCYLVSLQKRFECEEFEFYIGFRLVQVESLRFKKQSLIDLKTSPNAGSQKEPEEQPLPPYLDQNNNSYAVELAIALKAAKAVYEDGWRPSVRPNRSTKQLLEAWIDINYPDGTDAFKRRIATVANAKEHYETK